MKKFLFVALVVMLALPFVANAGTVNSRWDVTIGGFVKADFGWADQAVGADYMAAERGDLSYVFPTYYSAQNLKNKYSAIYMAAGETRLNFAIKGPDAWGAKTSAFIEGEFSGAWGSGSYGGFRLRHAFINFDWGKYSLLFGQTWESWGIMFPDALGRNEFVPFRRGQRSPQIRFTHNINPNWQWYFGVFQPNYGAQGNWNTTDANLASNYGEISNMPRFFGEINWSTDKCGKIGNDKLLIGFGGEFGQDKVPIAWLATGPGYYDLSYSSKNVNSWAGSVKAFIPIIPEKKGDKTGSLFIKGHFTYGQNYRPFAAVVGGTYDAQIDPLFVSMTAPTSYTGYGQIGYYITDKVWANFLYGTLKNNYSQSAMFVNSSVPVSAIRTHRQWAANVLYDVNPAVRMGVQFTNINTGFVYWGGTPTVGRSGDLNSARMAVWYFF